MVAGCSLKQPVQVGPTKAQLEELDRQAGLAVDNFLLDLYSSIEQEQLQRTQMADNSKDKKTSHDWTVVGHCTVSVILSSLFAGSAQEKG